MQLAQIETVLNASYTYAKQWKLDHEKRVIGVFLSDAPEELIDASDSLPFTLLGEGKGPGTGSSIPSFACSLIRNTLHQAFLKELEFLDGLVIPYLCDSSRFVFHLWKRNFPAQFCDLIRLPKKLNGEEVKVYLANELRRHKEAMESSFGVSITDEGLWKSIGIYNENRRYLRRIRALRSRNPNVMSNFEFFSLIKSSMLMPKNEHNQILTNVLVEMESSPVDSDSVSPKRVFLSGMTAVPFEIFQWMDEMGIFASDDDLAVGSRYFSYEVDGEGDPLAGLAESYFRRIPNALVEGKEDRLSYILKKVEDHDLEGVLFLQLKFCEPLIYDYPDLKKGLDREGIPNLFIETDLQSLASGQIKTRLQAFAEILEKQG